MMAVAQRWYGDHADGSPIIVATLWTRCGTVVATTTTTTRSGAPQWNGQRIIGTPRTV